MNKDDIIQSQIEPLLDYFQKVIPINNEEKHLVTEFFKPRLYRKKQYVLQEGDVCNQFNFIVRGCLRMYKIEYFHFAKDSMITKRWGRFLGI